MPKVVKQESRPKPRKTGSVVDRIQPIGSEERGRRFLIYGRSGTGKTTLWATFPGPILMIICSGGAKPGEEQSIDTPEYRKKISRVVLSSVSEMSELVDHVRETGKYGTVVLDHGSGFQDMTLKEILGLDELPAQKGWGMATQQQYGQSSLQCKESFRALMNLDTNVVIVAQERQFGEGDSSGGDDSVIQPTVGAAMSPSVVGWLNPACDCVVRTFIRPKMVEKPSKVNKGKMIKGRDGSKMEFCLLTGVSDLYHTKFRVPKGHHLPEVIVDPTYDKILRVIKGEKT